MSTDSTTPTADLATVYTAGQLDVITELRRIQDASGLSDAKFAQQHLTVHASNWGRVKSGTYGADNSAILLKLETNLRQIRLERAKAAKLTGGEEFLRLPSQAAVIDAITLAKLKPDDDCERLVVHLAETGGGKTRLGRQLAIMHDGIYVEASEPWRKSYYAAACDIALAAGVSKAALGTSEYSAQRALLDRLRVNRRVLIIDEGEYFGPRTTNLLKLILNQTGTVVVILAIPELARRWQKSAWVESAQTNRRSEAVVEAGEVFPEDVRLFAAAMGCKPLGRADLGMIAKAANDFGRYSLVKRVLKDLRTLENPTTEDTAKTITNTRALLRR